jgi:uncharacterized protein (TIGR02588 family)
LIASTIVTASTASEWVTAVGTVAAAVAAVAIALWGTHRERQGRPVLSLEFDHELRPPDFMAGMWSGDGQYESHWVRLRVENRAGKRSAEDVEVRVQRLERHDDVQDDGARTIDYVPLGWSSTRATEGAPPVTQVTIPPGFSRHVDLLAIDGEVRAPGVAHGKPIVAIQVWPPPTDDRHLLKGGAYTIHLAVAARDTDAAYYRIDVKVPSERLGADEIRNELEVSAPVPEKPPHLVDA